MKWSPKRALELGLAYNEPPSSEMPWRVHGQAVCIDLKEGCIASWYHPFGAIPDATEFNTLEECFVYLRLHE